MELESKEFVKFKIKRFDPRSDKEPRFDDFEVPKENGWSVMSALNHICENLDPSLAYYSSCRLGKCEGCDVLIDGELKLTCTTKLDRDMKLEPLDDFTLIRDLVVDKSKPKRKKVERLFGKKPPF